MKRAIYLCRGIALAVVVATAAVPASAASPTADRASVRTVVLPGVSGPVGFDDMAFVPALDRIVVPGGGTGSLYLIDPANNSVARLAKVAPAGSAASFHDAGTTSAAYAHGYFIASDHPGQSLAIVKAATGKVVAHVRLASGPDYVRYFAPLREVWVSEPRAQQIEVFDARFSGPVPDLSRAGTVSVPGGPESLAFDAARGRIYTNLWKSETLAIDVHTRRIVARWKNGCRGSRGLALAPRHDLLFVGCSEGKAVALDLAKNGRVVASARAGAGVDIIAWNPALKHLYVPGARSATLTILALAPGPGLHAVATVPTARGAHCVATDGRDKAYVCDPRQGRILAVTDGR